MKHLDIKPFDQKRLRERFHDNRIYFGRCKITHRLEAWYKPDSSAPYRITVAQSVGHAINLLEGRLAYDNMRAKDIIKQIDDHNDKLTADQHEDAMTEARSTLRGVARGRQLFIPPGLGRKS